MNEKKGGIDFLFIAIGIIALLAIGLGILQFNWINSFSRSSEARLRTSLNNSTLHALNSTRMETSLLYSILYLTSEEVKNHDYDRFRNDLESWKESSSFSGLLKSVYLSTPGNIDESPKIKRFIPGNGSFIEIPSPTLFTEAIANLKYGDFRGIKELEKSMTGLDIYLLNPVRSEAEQKTKHDRYPGLPPILILEIDTGYLYQTVLPYYLNNYLRGYPYSITTDDYHKTVFSRGQPPADQKPELSISVSKSLFTPFDEQFENRSNEDFSAALFIRLWMTIIEESNRKANDEQSEMFLNIYYPDGELSGQVDKTRIMNLIVSTGFILLFLAVLIILYSLYRRNREMRIRERNFISSMSHELRTPLAVIRSTADTLKKGIVKDPERIKQYSSTISKQTKRLSESVEGILKYSGLLNNGENYPADEIQDLSRMTEDTADAMNLLINERGGVLIKRIAPGISVKMNPEAYRLILENLLSNAVKHSLSPDETKNQSREIHIDLYREDEEIIVLIVSDKGPGISMLEKNKIFQPFYRGKRSRDNQTPGNGLGLHLINQTAEMLGGTIEVQSPCFPGEDLKKKGCRFIVRVPLEVQRIEG